MPVQDRMGLHLGEVVIEEAEQAAGEGFDRDAGGPGARVMWLAQGGPDADDPGGVRQRAAVAQRRGDRRDQCAWSWLNHGRFELKGVDEPVEICEVRAAGAADSCRRRRLRRRRGGWKRPKAKRCWAGGRRWGRWCRTRKWVLEQKLGEGGFGEVWLGRHQVMKERRVFKFCFRADRVRSLKREMTLFRLIKERIGDHPNIVRLREVYFDQPPYLRGGGLCGGPGPGELVRGAGGSGEGAAGDEAGDRGADGGCVAGGARCGGDPPGCEAGEHSGFAIRSPKCFRLSASTATRSQADRLRHWAGGLGGAWTG